MKRPCRKGREALVEKTTESKMEGTLHELSQPPPGGARPGAASAPGRHDNARLNGSRLEQPCRRLLAIPDLNARVAFSTRRSGQEWGARQSAGRQSPSRTSR